MALRCPSALRTTALAAMAATGLSLAAAGETGSSPMVDPTLNPLAVAAIADAATRLSSPPCSLVLTDYADSRTGLTLAETLAATGRTAAEHVHSLRFSTIEVPRRYEGKKVFAFTTPRGREVFLCREEFARIQTQRQLAVAVVIHETLHTLGLGNDLPSSVAITQRVLARCR